MFGKYLQKLLLVHDHGRTKLRRMNVFVGYILLEKTMECECRACRIWYDEHVHLSGMYSACRKTVHDLCVVVL